MRRKGFTFKFLEEPHQLPVENNIESRIDRWTKTVRTTCVSIPTAESVHYEDSALQGCLAIDIGGEHKEARASPCDQVRQPTARKVRTLIEPRTMCGESPVVKDASRRHRKWAAA